jgi:two-component system sensor histidine kinase YesM
MLESDPGLDVSDLRRMLLHVPRATTLQSILFLAFSSLFVVVFVGISLYLSGLARGVIERGAVRAIEEASSTLQRDVDAEIAKLEAVSLNVAYSELVKGAFAGYLEGTGEARVTQRRTLANALIAINGPQMPVKQIYLYDLTDRRVGIGMLNAEQTVRIEDQPWYGEVLEADGARVLAGPAVDATLAGVYTNQQGRLNLALLRLFFDRYRSAVGVMELIQDCEKVFSSPARFESGHEATALVLDGRGRVLYPYDRPVSVPQAVGEPTWDTPAGSFSHGSGAQRRFTAYSRSQTTGLVTVVSLSSRSLFREATLSTLRTTVVLLPVLLSVVLVSWLVSRRITRTLRIIHRNIEDMELSTIERAGSPTHGAPDELEELNRAVLAMRRKLKQSLDETLAAHRHEAEARLLALQAQVNPHFLHNTITTISAMAEEGMTGDIVVMCRNLSAMMRYLSDSRSTVTLGEEMEYTGAYLECMRVRFQERLVYRLRTDERMRGVPIPRLVVQPLVENSLKHGVARSGKTVVTVQAQCEPGGWVVRVTDNGPGFAPAALARLRARPDEGPAPTPRSGIGLASIVRRMRLHFGPGTFSFTAENSPEGGAVVTLRGAPCG